MTTSTQIRLNLGSGELPIEGWTNVDAYCPADVQGDIRQLVFVDVDEVNMSHLLEHLPTAETLPVLERVRGWMRPGGKLTVEVPDMASIMAAPPPDWVAWVYGAQNNPGEFHQTGFTMDLLEHALIDAGYHAVVVGWDVSAHPWRFRMPILIASCRA